MEEMDSDSLAKAEAKSLVAAAAGGSVERCCSLCLARVEGMAGCPARKAAGGSDPATPATMVSWIAVFLQRLHAASKLVWGL
jgi:hypothetical protein